jgi:hypothetical protein
MKMAEKIKKKVKGDFANSMDADFKKEFGVVLDTSFDFLGSWKLTSERVDGRKLTIKQKAWIKAYSAGYNTASEAIE